MDLFDNTVGALEKKLNLHFKRHTLLSGNAANSETPLYKARELDFAGEVERALYGKNRDVLEKTHPLHMNASPASEAHVVIDHTGAVGADGNNVDLDINMGKLSGNASGYKSSIDLLTIKLQMLSAAARGRAY